MKHLALVVAALCACGIAACQKKPNVTFAPYEDGYASKMDFAELEQRFPLDATQLNTLTPDNLAKLSQEQVDQIYARLSSGPIPDGPYEGGLFFADGGGLRRISQVLGGLKGSLVNVKLDELERVGQALWKGKVFFKSDKILRNMIRDRDYLKLIIDGDPDTLPTQNINGKKTWLLFPAKVYCGQSLLDGRRESIVIDYAFSDELPGYREKPDFLAGRRGLKVRDEIRMVRPGFYLGRAYIDRMFALNFTLYNPQVADAGRAEFLKTGGTNDECWIGTQRGAPGLKTAALH